jgi:hypothetical protein
MKTLTLSLVLAASPALAQVMRVGPMSALPLAGQYGAAAHTAGVSVAKTQYAIIHALTGWESDNLAGYSDFASYKMADQVLLQQIEQKAGLRIEVTPLSAADRRLLWEKAREVRAAHRYGRDSARATPKRAITEAEMQRRHEAIIASFASHVRLVPASAGGAVRVEERREGLPFSEQTYARQNRLFAALRLATEQLAAAATEADFKAALDRWNAAAAPFGKGRRVEWQPGQDQRAALDRALAYEHDEGRELSRMGEYLGHPSVYDALGRIKVTGAYFDGSRQGGPAPVRAGDFANAMNPESRSPHSAASSVVSAPVKADVPKPEGKEEKPGLFSMLGALLGKFLTGLLRTVMRVGAAVLKSAGLIGKALLS